MPSMMLTDAKKLAKPHKEALEGDADGQKLIDSLVEMAHREHHPTGTEAHALEEKQLDAAALALAHRLNAPEIQPAAIEFFDAVRLSLT